MEKKLQPAQSKMLVAFNAVQMQAASKSLESAMTKNISDIDLEIKTLTEEVAIAKRSKWRSSGLERQLNLARGRRTYYYKVRAAIKAGYQIVPNFPGIDVIAIRTHEDLAKPPKDYSSEYSWVRNSEIKAPLVPAGEGEYFAPRVGISTLGGGKDEKGKPEYHHYFGELMNPEFPVKLAHPEIMEVTSQAMALKVFDRICTLPALSRSPKGDPLVIGQVFAPKNGYTQSTVSFIIAWAIDPEDL